MSAQRHYIETQQLEIHISDIDDRNEFLATVSERYQEKILPALANLFETMTSADETIQINHLKIDVGTVSFESWEDHLIEAIARGVQQSIDLVRREPGEGITSLNGSFSSEIATTDPEGFRTTTDEAILRSFMFFLQHGYLNSNILSHLPSEAINEELQKAITRGDYDRLEFQILAILDRKPELSKSIHTALSSLPMIRRLIKQFSDVFCEALLQHLSANDQIARKKSILKKVLDVVEETFQPREKNETLFFRRLINFCICLNLSTQDTRACFDEYLLYFELPEKKYRDQIAKILLDGVMHALKSTSEDRIIPQFSRAISEVKRSLTMPNENSKAGNKILAPGSGKGDDTVIVPACTTTSATKGDSTTNEEASDEKSKIIFVDNAGMVLLSPFLPALFERLHLLDVDGHFVDRDAAVRGVHLLHYLATGAEHAREYLMVLPKIMCGLPVEFPVARDIDLSQEEKDECIDLLQSVIKHWSILKNTTPDGLRETFLIRSGKLEVFPDATKLVVEAKSVDMLMEHLPWSISFIRFSWLNKIITIEWCN